MSARHASSAVVVLLALGAPAHAAGCALGAAVYKPAEGEAATLRFTPGPKPAEANAFGFAMTLGPRASYRFRMAAASGAGESYAELVADGARSSTTTATPGGRLGARSEREEQDDDAPASPIHFFDERFRRVEPETLNDPAPAAVFLPELQRAFVYWSANPDQKTVPTAGMWLRACDR